MKVQIPTIIALLLVCQTGWTQDSEDRPPNGRRGPPAEALAACESATAGDACSFEMRGETLTGVCSAPEDRPLACVPENHRRSQNLLADPAQLVNADDASELSETHCPHHPPGELQ